MRYDTPVYFQQRKAGEYDKVTGNYAPDTVEEVMAWADITTAGANTLKLVFGDITQEAYTLRIQHRITSPFDRIRIGEGDDAKLYSVKMRRKLRKGETFVICEVQGNAVY